MICFLHTSNLSGWYTWERCYNPVKYPELSIAHHLSRRYFSPHLKNWMTDMGANLTNMQV
jgi:hypothetical protein